MRHLVPVAAMLLLAGCATTYQMNLMPRDSGRTYAGSARDNGTGEGSIDVSIEGKTYQGSWVSLTPDRGHAYVSGGLGFGRGRWGWGGLGTTLFVENPYGSASKALLTAQDGSGLRCDLRMANGRGGGLCRDDKGREYDVQLRPAPRG